MSRKERQRANRRAKAQAIEELGLPKDTKYVDHRAGISRRNSVNAKDLTPYYAMKYMNGRIPEEDRIYVEGVHYGP